MVAHSSWGPYTDTRFNSAGIWRDCPILDIERGQKDGFFVREDFHGAGSAEDSTAFSWTGAKGLRYVGFGTAGVLMAQRAAAVGQDNHIGVLAVTTDANNEEAYVGIDKDYGGPLMEISDAAGDTFDFWYETRVAFNNITGANGMNKAIGLSNEDAVKTAALTGTDEAFTSFLGLFCVEADGLNLDLVGVKAGTRAAIKEDVVALVADTFYNFGCRYVNGRLSFYFEGLPIADAQDLLPAHAAVPDAGPLMPFWGHLAGSSGTGVMYVDGFQLAILNAR